MKRPFGRVVHVLAVTLFIILLPAMNHAQSEQTTPGPPPTGVPLVREGTFAMKLEFGLAIGTTEDEAEAENRLAEVGIVPRNGWIADYPVTPDIIGELQNAVSDAAGAGKIALGKEEALKRFQDALVDSGLSITPYSGQEAGGGGPPGAERYPNPATVNSYYYNEGPPVATCYAPPPNFYYLYAWVSFPFWWSGFWFPGFFVLHDFHLTVTVNRRVAFVSNHFRDISNNRVLRIDPVARFNGKTFAGIGAPRSRDFLPTGTPGSDRKIFNEPPWGRSSANPTPWGRATVAPPSPPARSGTTVVPPARGGEPARPPSRGGREPAEGGRKR